MGKEAEFIVLEATSVMYFSDGDEAAFFAWLDKISSVDSYKGRGSTLYIKVNATAVDANDLREIIALFHRYGVDLRQLAVFDRKKFSWFRRKNAYWHEDVFG